MARLIPDGLASAVTVAADATIDVGAFVGTVAGAVCATTDCGVSALEILIASGTSAFRFVLKLFSFWDINWQIVGEFAARFKAMYIAIQI